MRLNITGRVGIVFYILLALILITPGVSAIDHGKQDISFLTYENQDYGVKIDYPSDWSVHEKFMGTVVAFQAPLDNPVDQIHENVNIVIEELPDKNISLDQLTAETITQLKQLITNINIVTSTKATLLGNEAHMVVFTGKQGKYNLKWLQIWTIKDGWLYAFTSLAEKKNYDRYSGIIQYMIASFSTFEVLDPGKSSVVLRKPFFLKIASRL